MLVQTENPEWKVKSYFDGWSQELDDHHTIEFTERLYKALCVESNDDGISNLYSLLHDGLDPLIEMILHPDDLERFQNGRNSGSPDAGFRFEVIEWVQSAIYGLVEDGRIEWVNYHSMPAIFIPDYLLDSSDDNRARAMELEKMPYSDYLFTPEWRSRRERHLEHAGHACQVCNRPNSLHVHHRTYVRRGRERFSDLIVLCATCHKTFHDNLRVARPTEGK